MSRIVTVFGGQFGSEGKGEVAALLTQAYKATVGIRIGGPNAGHTSYDHLGRKVVVQTLPTPAALTGCLAVIGPEGCFIPEILIRECAEFQSRFPSKRLNIFLDPFCAVITDEHMTREAALKGRIGSTGEGVGAVTADKVMRKPVTLKDYDWHSLFEQLEQYNVGACMVDTCHYLNQTALENKGEGYPTMILEGTQGAGLSLHTSGYYPFATSRECTPYALWSGTGINPQNYTKVETIMVMRTYPIRVGGNSGPMKDEITWEWLQKEKGLNVEPEKTTVTKKVRRIGKLDWVDLERVMLRCPVDGIAVTFLDYEFPDIAGLRYADMMGKLKYSKVFDYLETIERRLGAEVTVISTGAGKASFTDRHPLFFGENGKR